MPFSPIPAILEDLRSGRMIVLTDDEKRENEGDLVLPAQFATPEAITFMLSVARGYMCLSMTEADCDRLELHPQAAVNTTMRGTAFTVSIDLHPKYGGTTGVSAKERAKCVQMAIDPKFGPEDFVRPGHINPLRSRDGGTLVRTGQTEGSLDLCRLAGLYPAALIIEIMRDDGEMARLPDLEKICAQHNLKMCSVAQIIEHRLARESLVRRLEPRNGRPIRTPEGAFNLIGFESLVDPQAHLALTLNLDQLGPDEPALVRVHRRHILGDIFSDLDSSPEGPTSGTLQRAMRAIQREGKGVLVYLRPEGVGEALDQRLTTVRRDPAKRLDPDTPDLRASNAAAGITPGASHPLREFGVGVQILRDLGITKLRLLTNHKQEYPGIEAFGVEIVERVGL